MERIIIFVAVTALLMASSWIPGTEAEGTVKDEFYGEDDDEIQATTLITNTAATERHITSKDRSYDEMDDDFLEEKSQDNGSFGSKIVSKKRNNEREEDVPKSSPLLAESSNSGYRMPGLFGFNGGEPFYLEKDPITGAVNFSTKASSLSSDDEGSTTGGPSLKNHKISEVDGPSDDYYYDDEEDGDNIDRKDSTLDDASAGRPNYINPYRDYPPTLNDVNIRVDEQNNYKDQNSKFPLISSSYANTKVQGTAGGINRNHRPYATSSTQSPSYYTIRPQPTFLTSTQQPLSRGTVKYGSSSTYNNYKTSQHNSSPQSVSTEETIYYKPNTERHEIYNSNKNIPHTSQQEPHNTHTQTFQGIPQQNYERYEEEMESGQIKKQQQQTSDYPHMSTTSSEAPVSIYPIKTTQQPFDYEEETNEDYDTEAPTGFSLSELFGYGKPSVKTENKKSPQDGKQQNQQLLQQQEHGYTRQDQYQKPVPFTSTTPTSAASVTQTKIHQEFNSEEHKYINEKNQNREHIFSTIKPLTTKSSTTQSYGIIYSEPSTLQPQKIDTSVSLDSKFQTNQQSASRYPEVQQSSHNKHSDTHHKETSDGSVPDLVSISSEKVKANIPVAPIVNQQGKPTYFGSSPTFSNVGGGHFDSNVVKNTPYGSYAEEPFRPIFGPGEIENRPSTHHPEHQPLVAPNKNRITNGISNSHSGQVSKPSTEDNAISSKIPQETPSRWNYPYNEGTSSFFQSPVSHHQQKQNIATAANPLRIPGVETPRPHPQTPPFVKLVDAQGLKIHSEQQKPIHSSETHVDSLIPNHSGVQNNDFQRPTPSQVLFKPEWLEGNTKKKSNGEGHVIFPDSHPEGTRPEDEITKRPTTTVIGSTNTEMIMKEVNFQQPPVQSWPPPDDVGSFEIKPTTSQRRPPLPSQSVPRPINQNGPQIPNRNIVQEPAQDLTPPAEPENLRKNPVSGNYPRPQWESHLAAQPQFHPQIDLSQVARPKHDTVPPHFGQNSPSFGNGYRVHPGFTTENSFQGNRPQQIPKNRNHDSNLPNILPQFRPNAKISHVHAENGGRIQTYPYYGPQRQPLLERPSRRPPSEFMGHLHPPPPPHHRRVNRNDSPGPTDGYNKVEDILPFEKYPPQPPSILQQRPLVHRRTGPHVTDVSGSHPQVATLQMMQHQQHGVNTHFIPRPLVARDDFPNSNDEMKPPLQVKYPSGSPLNAEASEKQPVFVVYPVNSTPLNIGGNSNNGGVVVGTRGPQRPLPPSNLDSELSLSSEELVNGGPLTLPFPVYNKNQKPVLQLATDRHDVPSLDTQYPKNSETLSIDDNGRPIKSNFPYPLERPDALTDRIEDLNQDSDDHKGKVTNEGMIAVNSNDRYDNEFSLTNDQIQAEVHNSRIENNNEDDTEINIIPYLQDYMPFATKKPITSTKSSSEKNPTTITSSSIPLGMLKNTIKPEKEIFQSNQWTTISGGYHTQDARIVNTGVSENEVHGLSSTPEPQRSSSQISVVLKTVQPQQSTTYSPLIHSTLSVTDYPKSSSLSTTSITAHGASVPSSHQQGIIGSGGSEFTVSAVMHTHPQQALSNHRPADVFSSTPPPQLNFQAPFLASANIGGAAPTNQGWSVVGSGGPSNERMKPGTVDKADLHREELEVPEVKSGNEGDQNKEPTNFDFENFRPQLFGGFKPIYTFPEENAEGQSKYLQSTERQEKMIS